MLDINFIRNNPQKVKEGCEKKQIKIDIDELLRLDKEKRKLQGRLDELRAERNKISSQKVQENLLSRAREIKEEIKKIEPRLHELEKKLREILLSLPNLPFDEVPVGKDDSQNLVLRKVGKTPSFKFSYKNYLELAEKLDLIDVKRAAKISGPRFGFLKKEAVLLQFALINFAFDILTKKGFIPILPPVMLKTEMARGTGYFEATNLEEAYFLPKDNLYLAGTSEQPLIAMHANEIFDEEELPKRYVGYSTCFRREAGSYGKDTRGILRVHQFDKVEMIVFCKPEESKKEHQLLLSLEEKLMQALKLPYQVVNICSGDLGMPAAAKFDIETWIPSEKRYRETHSTSNCTDFQARRLDIKYRARNGELRFVHTLNGTAFAMGRTLIAIIENYQQKDGSIKVPRVLQKYCGFKIIKGCK